VCSVRIRICIRLPEQIPALSQSDIMAKQAGFRPQLNSNVACIAKKLKSFPGWNKVPSLTWLLLLLVVVCLFDVFLTSCACYNLKK
jgi:hypothetical protein